MTQETPAALIQRQLDAYNAKDIDGWLATYAPDAEQYQLHGELLAKGHAVMRERMLQRFAEPDLFARVLSRTCMGPLVIDHELITRNFPEGKGSIEMICIYEVANGLIQKGSFALAEKTVFAKD
jgi:putative hydrolase of HD superfamily